MASDIDKLRRVVMGRSLRALVVGLGLALVLGAPVAAGTSDSRYFQRGHQAVAWKGVCRTAPDSDVTTCRSFSIQVFSGRRGGTDAATRFRGYELSVSMSKERSNNVTGELLGSRVENGSVANSDALRVRFDELRGASVEGTIRVQVQSCPRRGECVEGHRKMALDLDWTARPGPASDSFTYSRYNDAGCEYTYTETRRARQARTVGQVDGSDMRASGWLIRSDLLTTTVCQ
ncbi:MAG: hypothetical protein M3395_00120 [Chloroflexota bacterium]|nr:hypothetical protein [Chloroflexota bacterium]